MRRIGLVSRFRFRKNTLGMNKEPRINEHSPALQRGGQAAPTRDAFMESCTNSYLGGG